METSLALTDHEIANAIAVKPIRIIEILNPFRVEERSVTEIDYQPSESMGEIITRAGHDPQAFTCSLNGEIVSYDAICETALRPGWEIVLYPNAGGGILKIASMLALAILVSAITAGAGGVGFLAFLGPFLTAGQAALIASTVSVAGSLLISWAFAPGQPTAPAWSTTYDPTGPKGLAQPGTPVPKGYGTMGWCGNIVSSYVDFDGANAYINVLVCYGWGVAASISNLLINLKPISNYTQVNYFTRLGTNTQTAIDGFDKTVNGYPQETQLLVSNGPVIVNGTGTDIQGLDITIKLPSGLYRVTNDGNTVPLKVIYKVEVAPHSTDAWVTPLFARNTATIKTTHTDGSVTWPAWVVVPTDRFAGSGIVYATDNGSHTAGDAWSGTQTITVVNYDSSTSSSSATFVGEWQPTDPNLNQALVTDWWEGFRVIDCTSINAFFDTVSVYGLTAGQWDVRVTKIGYCQDNNDDVVLADATDNKHISDIWLWNINEIFWSNLTYPNMILVGVKALATSQMSGEDIQVMATVVHDIGADTVIPSALSAFEHDNPAIVAYDVLTNPIYGMNVAASLIDVPAFVAWASFNDETVTNQDGSNVRRHIFAGVFDQSGDAWKALQSIGNMSRANVIQLGMRYTVILDAPADPVQLFTVGNTKKDSFTENWLALDDRCTLIECDFADAARTYRMDLPVSVMTETDINSGIQPKVTRTKLLGCTSRDQAWRWAYFHLLNTKLSLRTIQFTAPIEAICCSIGSVIAMQSDVVQWATGGRVLSGSTTTTVNVDRTDVTFAEAAGWTLSVQHPVVQRGTATISSISGLNVTMTAGLPAGRVVKIVGPTGTEYTVTGVNGSTATLAYNTTGLATGQTVTLYDTNVIDNLDVTGIVVTPEVGAAITVASPFSAVPSADSAWAYGQSAGYQPAKLFRVISMKKSGDFAIEIGALEYNTIPYEDVVPNYGEIIGVPNSSPDILNLTLTEVYQNGTLTGSTNSAVIAVGWQNANTAVGAQVQVKNANASTWTTLGNIDGQGCTFVGYIGTTYDVQVTGFNWQGTLFGAPATASITVAASTSAPANVTGVTGYATATTTVLSWAAVSGADHYEIRYAADPGTAQWTTATVLTDTTSLTYTDSSAGTGIYMIKAVTSASTGSVESVTPATFQNSAQKTFAPLAGLSVWFPPSAGVTGAIGPEVYELDSTAGGTLICSVPLGGVTGRDGTYQQIAAQSITFAWPSVSASTANATFYAYLYLDDSLNIQTVNGTKEAGTGPNWLTSYTGSTPLDASPNGAHAAAVVDSGPFAWLVSLVLNVGGSTQFNTNVTLLSGTISPAT